MTTAEKLTQIAENQQSLYGAGILRHMRDCAYRCNIQKNFLYAFAGQGWNNSATIEMIATYCPPETMVFDCTTNSSNMYAYSGVTNTIATIDLRNASGNAKTTFANANRLVTVARLLVSETTPGLQFTGCSKLENITVEGVIAAGWNLSASPLTKATVQHLLEHLKDLTGQTTQTLTLKSAVGAALTAAQKAAITAKNWTLVY